jgi:hypothetical protein
VQIGTFAYRKIEHFYPFCLKNSNSGLFLQSFLIQTAMAVTRLKRKNRKDKAKSAVRRQTLKIQNFKPVIKNVDVEKIKDEFKAKADKKKA